MFLVRKQTINRPHREGNVSILLTVAINLPVAAMMVFLILFSDNFYNQCSYQHLT